MLHHTYLSACVIVSAVLLCSGWVITKERVENDIYYYVYKGTCKKVTLNCGTNPPAFQSFTCKTPAGYPDGFDTSRETFPETVCNYQFRGMDGQKWQMSNLLRTEWTKEHCLKYVGCVLDKLCSDSKQRSFEQLTGLTVTAVPGIMNAMATLESLKDPKEYDYGKKFKCNS